MKNKNYLLDIPISMLCILFLSTVAGCFSFRISDKKAKADFKTANADLQLEDIEVNGFTLHYAKTGNDTLPILFFVHGTPGSWSAFRSYLKDTALQRKYQLISIDRPGFGKSNFGNAMNLSQQSKIISHLFTKLNKGKPIFLIGHSLGGPMICRLAIDNPGMISGLVILAGSQDPAAEKPEKWRPVLFKTSLNLLVPGSWRPSNEELWYLKKDLIELKYDLCKISCPVYLAHGSKDILVPFSNVGYTMKMLTGTSKKEIIVFEDDIEQVENHFLPSRKFNEIKQLLLTLY